MKKKSGEERSETAFKRYQDRIMAEDNRYASFAQALESLPADRGEGGSSPL
jgi:hypothetical protein